MKKALFFLPLVALILGACSNVGESYHLREGETLAANQYLVVVKAELDADSVVEGDLNVTASEAVIDAHVQGDLTIVASNLTIGAEAVIDGDLIYCVVSDGKFERQEGAVIWGDVQNSCSTEAESKLIQLNKRQQTPPIVWVGGALLFSLSAGLVASLGTIFFPKHMMRISLVAQEYRLMSAGLGFFTLIVAWGLSVLYMFSLIIIVPLLLAPIVAVAWVLLLLLIVLGSVSVAQPFGAWLMRRLRFEETVPIVTSTVGAGVLTFLLLIFTILNPFPFITWILALALISWALGATLLTRGGTQFYRGHKGTM